jgi:methyl-accepting chemotaxis protein
MKLNLMKPIEYLVNLTRKVLNQISIRERLIVFFLILTLTPVLIIGLIAGRRFEKAVTAKTVHYSLAELAQAAVNIQLKLAEYETISLQLFVNNEFITTLENFLDTGNNSPNAVIRETVKSCFNEYMTNKNDLFGFMFLPISENLNSIIVTKDFQKDFINLSENFIRTSAGNNILKADGGIVWSATQKINRSNFLILGRLIKRISNGKPLGILAIIIDEDKIDQLANLPIYNDLNNSLNGIESYSLVINSNGEIVSSPFKEDIGQSASQLVRNIGLRKSNAVPESKIDQGSFFTTVNQQKSLVTYKAVSKIGKAGKGNWYLVNLAPASFLYKEQRAVTIATIALSLIFGILGVWASFSVTNMIYKKGRPKIRRHKRFKGTSI